VKELGFTSIPTIVVETSDEDTKARTIVYKIVYNNYKVLRQIT
jgi:hypothetical protein